MNECKYPINSVLYKSIEEYIKECNYTWDVDEIVTEYLEKFSHGWYVSHTCKNVINKFKSELEKEFKYLNKDIDDIEEPISVWLAVDKDGKENMYSGGKPFRHNEFHAWWPNEERNIGIPKSAFIELPIGTIQVLTGKRLKWDDDCIEYGGKFSMDNLSSTINNKLGSLQTLIGICEGIYVDKDIPEDKMDVTIKILLNCLKNSQTSVNEIKNMFL